MIQGCFPRCRWGGIFLMLAVLAVPACRKAPERPIRIGLLVWPPYEIFYLAQEMKLLDPARIELVDFSSNAEAADAFQTGAIDAVCLTTDLYISNLQADPEARIVMVVDISNGGDALLAGPEVYTTHDLRGAVVAVSPSSLGLYLLVRALEGTGVELEDLTLMHLDELEQVDAYELREVDAIVAYEPVRSRLLEAGARTLFDSSEIPGEIVDLLIVREEIMKKREPEIQALVDAFFIARDELIENPDASAERIAGRESLTPRAFLNALDQVILPNAEINREMLVGPDPPMQLRLNSVARVLQDIAVIEEIPDFENSIEERFVRNAGR